MPQTLIKIKTWTCSHCGSQRDSHPSIDIGHPDTPEGKCHFCHENLLDNDCTGQECLWLQETNKEKCCFVEIRAEEDFDNPDTITHAGRYMTRQEADEQDEHALKTYLKKENERLFIERSARGEKHVPLTEKDDHGWVAPERTELSKKERKNIKAKIRADIAKFKTLEFK